MSAIEYTLPHSVIEVIEATGSPSAGLRKFKQLSGLVPVRPLYDATMGDVRKREQLGQFCSVFAPQVKAAKETFAASQSTPAPTTRKPKATRKSEKVEVSMSEAAIIRALEQRIEALEAGLGASEPKAERKASKARKPKAAKVAKADVKLNTFTPKVVAKFSLPKRVNATFVWPSTGTQFVVVAKTQDGGIQARKAA